MRVEKRVFWGVALAFAAGLGLGHGVRADDVAGVTGVLSASAHEADEGYFAIGPGTMVAVKPDSALYRWLRARLGQHVRLTVGTAAATD